MSELRARVLRRGEPAITGQGVDSLTPRDAAVLAAIREFTVAYGRSPSVRNLAAALGQKFNHRPAARCVERLVRLGLIARDAERIANSKAGGLRIVERVK